MYLAPGQWLVVKDEQAVILTAELLAIDGSFADFEVKAQGVSIKVPNWTLDDASDRLPPKSRQGGTLDGKLISYFPADVPISLVFRVNDAAHLQEVFDMMTICFPTDDSPTLTIHFINGFFKEPGEPDCIIVRLEGKMDSIHYSRHVPGQEPKLSTTEDDAATAE
jgi:hypothetical protein